MAKLRIAFMFAITLIACGKPTGNNELLAGKAKLQVNTFAVGQIVTAPLPPVVITEDLAVTNPTGPDIIVATTEEYNAMEPSDKIYANGLKNAIQHLFENPTYTSSILNFNDDDTYLIYLNTDPVANFRDHDDGNENKCKVCGLRSAYKCIDQVKKYMNDNHLKTIRAQVTLTEDNCVEIVYQYIEPDETTNETGTLVETYAPPGVVIITFPHSAFENYISTVKFWAANAQEGPNPLPVPLEWTRQALTDFVIAFRNDPTHPIHPNQTDPSFQTQLEYYINNIMTNIN